MLLLTAADLRELLPYPDCVAALELALARDAVAPPRQHLAAGGGLLLVMPAFQREPAGLGVKLVGVFEENPARGLDRIQALYAYFDPETGRPLALLEVRALTAIRTAAVSALATLYLANPGTDTMAVFGTGVQARAHNEALRATCAVRRVLVRGSSEGKSRAFAAEMGAEPADAAGALEAGIICTCTSSPAPLFDGTLLRPGTHINAVGNHRPACRELDQATVRRSRLVVDTRDGAFSEAGDLLLPIGAGAISRDHVLADLPELAGSAGGAAIHRSAADITLFKSVGHSLQDLAVARVAVSRALAAGRGATIEL